MPEKKRYQSRLDAHARFDKENTKRLACKLNIHTDADILAHLASQPNVQGYIKRLIREDMARGGASTDSDAN